VKSMQEVVARVELGVNRAQQAGVVIEQIRRGSGQVVSMVGDITLAIKEQSTASSHIAVQVERIAQMSEAASCTAGDTARAADALKLLAQQMQLVVARYRL